MATITLTEKAAVAVKKIMADTIEAEKAKRASAPVAHAEAASGGETATATATATATVEAKPEDMKLYLRVSVVGAGCSGFSNRLDLDFTVNSKKDETFEVDGVPIVIDKRSLMYLDGVNIDFHSDLNRTGFSVTNPNAKSTCGCGSSYSM